MIWLHYCFARDIAVFRFNHFTRMIAVLLQPYLSPSSVLMLIPASRADVHGPRPELPVLVKVIYFFVVVDITFAYALVAVDTVIRDLSRCCLPLHVLPHWLTSLMN